ncbi:hypothetical protein PTKIN_Ptkin08bG0132900 [Pterospermum kingtungense]
MGKRLAVLVGCNYPSTRFNLNGCINDMIAIRDLLLKRCGFDPSRVELLTDVYVQGSTQILPTGANIKASLNRMVDQAGAGDVLFFYFSGHGTVVSSLKPDQAFIKHEAVVPCDFNLITDMDLRQLIRRLTKGTSFTILLDSCHSGCLIDKDKEQQIGSSTVDKLNIPPFYHKPKKIDIGTIVQCLESVASNIVQGTTEAINTISSLFSGIFGKDVSLGFLPHLHKNLQSSLDGNEGILLCGCEAGETSADVVGIGGKAYGAFTSQVQKVLAENHYALSNKQLVMMVRQLLKEQGFQQHACLYCSDEDAGANFLGSPQHSPKHHMIFGSGVITHDAIKIFWYSNIT